MAENPINQKEFKKLMKTLKKLPANIQKNVVNGGIRAGAVSIKDEAKRKAPERTGTLKKALVVRKSRSKNKKITKYRVALTFGEGAKYDAYYGSMIEYGTSKTPAQPFMRPAFESKASQTVEIARAYIAKRIDKEVNKTRQRS